MKTLSRFSCKLGLKSLYCMHKISVPSSFTICILIDEHSIKCVLKEFGARVLVLEPLSKYGCIGSRISEAGKSFDPKWMRSGGRWFKIGHLYNICNSSRSIFQQYKERLGFPVEMGSKGVVLIMKYRR